MKFNITNHRPAQATSRVMAWLVVSGGIGTALPSFVDKELELLPMFCGLSILLLVFARKEPLKLAFAFLLLVSLRIYLYQDERYIWHEIVLSDYLLVAISFAALFRLRLQFWTSFLRAFAFSIPLAGLASYISGMGSSLQGEGFRAGELSINQTAFLIGACLTLSLVHLYTSITNTSHSSRQGLRVMAWSLCSVLAMFLLINSGSRAGLMFPFLSVIGVIILLDKAWITETIRRKIQAAWPKGFSNAQKRLGGLILLASGAFAAWGGLAKIYASPENILSDMHRLHLVRCYAGSIFSGNNRFLYGMGFTRASQTICHDAGLITGTDQPHAHNILAQVAADNGFFALLALVSIIAILALRAKRISQFRHMATEDMRCFIYSSICLLLFTFLFLLVEGGWGKISFLQVIVGSSIAALSIQLNELTERRTSPCEDSKPITVDRLGPQI